ncbi:MAG: DUF819 family protein, partial [Bacteroidales bacterium]
MIGQLLQLSFIFLFPVLTIYLEKHYKIFKILSPILLCYAAGIIAGNIPFITLDKNLLDLIQQISICLVIPLLLFSSNFIKWLMHAKDALLSFFLGVAAVIICSILAYFVFRGRIEESREASAMIIGVYTGGTPNMSAIGLALGVKDEIFVLLNSADILFSAIYLFFLITIAQRFLLMFLPRFKSIKGTVVDQKVTNGGFRELSAGKKVKNILFSLLLAVFIFGIAAGISWLIKEEIVEPIIILVITTLGIAFSFNNKVQKLKGAYESAQYLLLVFAVAVGSDANFSELLKASSEIFYFCGMVVICSIILHFLFAAIFQIDADTLIITSTAAIFGPDFIGPVAKAINNREIIVSGITMGL